MRAAGPLGLAGENQAETQREERDDQDTDECPAPAGEYDRQTPAAPTGSSCLAASGSRPSQLPWEAYGRKRMNADSW